jgi:hypothetical protein
MSRRRSGGRGSEGGGTPFARLSCRPGGAAPRRRGGRTPPRPSCWPAGPRALPVRRRLPVGDRLAPQPRGGAGRGRPGTPGFPGETLGRERYAGGGPSAAPRPKAADPGVHKATRQLRRNGPKPPEGSTTNGLPLGLCTRLAPLVAVEPAAAGQPACCWPGASSLFARQGTRLASAAADGYARAPGARAARRAACRWRRRAAAVGGE